MPDSHATTDRVAVQVDRVDWDWIVDKAAEDGCEEADVVAALIANWVSSQ